MGERRTLEQTSDLGESIGDECTDPRIGKKLERKARVQVTSETTSIVLDCTHHPNHTVYRITGADR